MVFGVFHGIYIRRNIANIKYLDEFDQAIDRYRSDRFKSESVYPSMRSSNLAMPKSQSHFRTNCL